MVHMLGNSGAYTGWGYNRMLNRYLGQQIDHTSFMGKELTSKGSKVARELLGPKTGSLTSGTRRASLGFGGMALGLGIGVPLELKKGTPLPIAIAKEAALDMAIAAAPETLAYYMAGSFAKHYPDFKRMKERQRDYMTNYRHIGGDYIDKQTNYKSRARAMEQIKRSRQNIQANIGKEARRYHKN